MNARSASPFPRTSNRPVPIARVLLDVGALGRNQRTSPGNPAELGQDLSLRQCLHGHCSGLPTLGPVRLEYDPVAALSVARPELDGLFSAKTEGPLQLERDADSGVGDSFQLVPGYVSGLARGGGICRALDPVVRIVAGDNRGFVDFFRPPAENRELVLKRPGAPTLRTPVRDQRFDVLGLQPLRIHQVIAELAQGPSRSDERKPPIRSRRVAPVGIPGAEIDQPARQRRYRSRSGRFDDCPAVG